MDQMDDEHDHVVKPRAGNDFHLDEQRDGFDEMAKPQSRVDRPKVSIQDADQYQRQPMEGHPVEPNDEDDDGMLPKHSRALIGIGLCVYAVMRFPPMVSFMVVLFVLGTTFLPFIMPYIEQFTGRLEGGSPHDIYKQEFWEDSQRGPRDRNAQFDYDGESEGLRRRDRQDLGPPTQPVSKRFEFAFEDRGDSGDERRGSIMFKGKGKGRGSMLGNGGKGMSRGGNPRPRLDDPDERRRNVVRGDVDKDLQRLCDDSPILRPMDFDFRCRRFFSELKLRDTDRYNEAIDLLLKSTMEKSRDAVRNWPAYLYTLLRKFDPDLYDELRAKDDERRQRERAERGSSGF